MPASCGPLLSGILRREARCFGEEEARAQLASPLKDHLLMLTDHRGIAVVEEEVGGGRLQHVRCSP